MIQITTDTCGCYTKHKIVVVGLDLVTLAADRSLDFAIIKHSNYFTADKTSSCEMNMNLIELKK